MMSWILQLVGLVLLTFFSILEISSGRFLRIVRGFLALGFIVLFGLLDIQDFFKDPVARISISIVYVLAILSILLWAFKATWAKPNRPGGPDSSAKL